MQDMKKKDIKIKINTVLWEKVKKKLLLDFGKEFNDADTLRIISLLYLYKRKNKQRQESNYDIVSPDPTKEIYETKTIEVYADVMDKVKEACGNCTNSKAVERAIADFLYLPLSFYTDNLAPVYSFIGSKNIKMQKAVADAIEKMTLNHNNTTLIDGCCGTGSLFFGLDTYDWKHVILNDMNPIKTNILNVIKENGLEFIKYIFEDGSWQFENAERLAAKKEFKEKLDEYSEKRKKYHKVDCDIDIAMKTLLYHCWDGQYPENKNEIFERIIKILPSSLKLQKAEITQENCLKYLDNSDKNKFIILDVPYIGTEKQCGVKVCNYGNFHPKVADKLQQADYPFLYFCRSSAPKSDKSRPKEELEIIMKKNLAKYFYNKGYFFQKIHLDNKKVTELIISNQLYDNDCQFEWDRFDKDIIN